mmetsp:Transcript_16616/g.43919  ORF Transcript_16616/g.43919 Transcript_16616/m.43919 type:complete len:538 (+) Transcript_16616:49-1662(+)
MLALSRPCLAGPASRRPDGKSDRHLAGLIRNDSLAAALAAAPVAVDLELLHCPRAEEDSADRSLRHHWRRNQATNRGGVLRLLLLLLLAGSGPRCRGGALPRGGAVLLLPAPRGETQLPQPLLLPGGLHSAQVPPGLGGSGRGAALVPGCVDGQAGVAEDAGQQPHAARRPDEAAGAEPPQGRDVVGDAEGPEAVCGAPEECVADQRRARRASRVRHAQDARHLGPARAALPRQEALRVVEPLQLQVLLLGPRQLVAVPVVLPLHCPADADPEDGGHQRRERQHEVARAQPDLALLPPQVEAAGQRERDDREDDRDRAQEALQHRQPEDARQHGRGPVGAPAEDHALAVGHAGPPQHGLDRADERLVHAAGAPDRQAGAEALPDDLLLHTARRELQEEAQQDADGAAPPEAPRAALRDQDAREGVDGGAGDRRQHEEEDAREERGGENHGEAEAANHCRHPRQEDVEQHGRRPVDNQDAGPHVAPVDHAHPVPRPHSDQRRACALRQGRPRGGEVPAPAHGLVRGGEQQQERRDRRR